MSTRCNVHVIQEGVSWEEIVQLYHHCDGYPTNMLPLFVAAFEKSGKGWKAGRAGKAASYLCVADPGEFEPESHLGLHGDIEFFYKLFVSNSKNGSMAEKPEWFVQVFTGHQQQLSERLPIKEAAEKAEQIEASEPA